MKPVLILCHADNEGPGYLGQFLTAHGISHEERFLNATRPEDLSAYSGLVLMGGPMSVNDDLPWISQELALIQQAMAADKPVLGHCLGGQLISKALGARVGRNPVKELGWGTVTVANHPVATHWFGPIHQCQMFHWHGETFDIPATATLILSSVECHHQGYALGKHLALQCHVEMTEEMVADWASAGLQEIAEAEDSPAVQSAKSMQQDLPARIAELRQVADQLYSVWITGLV